MADPAAISGTFADLKSVKTRSAVQMVIEVPIEQAAQLVKLFGYPQPGHEVPVTVFRPTDAPQKPVESPKSDKVPKPFSDYPRSQQAAMACKDGDFQKWMWETRAKHLDPHWNTDELLKEKLDISSKTELDKDVGKTASWDGLYARYLSETGRVAEVR